jgi:hypothetical protein
MLSDSNRISQTDKIFDADASNELFSNYMFIRLVAKAKRFTRVDFKYSIFDSCYVRDCVFDSCDFTGCRFVGTNFHGSIFSGCKFDYATFDKTMVDSNILDDGCPGHENLKMRFARTLRMNYQQLGDAQAVNKAIRVELQATEAHLHKAWHSNESYYRKKYAGFRRAKAFTEWTQFKVLDFLWGNGESAPKLLRAILLAILLIAFVDAIVFKDHRRLESYTQAMSDSPQIFLGTMPTPASYPRPCLAAILFVRLIVFSFLTAIIVKRFNRR